MKPRSQSNNQVVGNVGLFYVCYRLSCFGWNVMPTARNARGIDIIIYSQDATRTRTLQVKALSKHNPVPLGGKLEGHFGDFFIICRNVAQDMPECYVLTPAEVRALAHKGDKDGKTSYWLQPKQYDSPNFHDRWDRIGKGSTESLPDNEPIATIDNNIVIDASFQGYLFKELKNGSIEVLREGVPLTPVKPVLRELAIKLNASLRNGNDNPFNTRQLGDRIIKRIRSSFPN